MKVRMLVSRSGPGISDSVGDVISVPAEEAKRMIAAGQAVAVTRAKKAAKKRAEKSEATLLPDDTEKAIEE